MATNSQQIKHWTRRLIELSRDDDGRISDERALAAVEAVKRNPPCPVRPLLKAFLRALRTELARQQLLIQFAQKPSEEELEALRKAYSQKAGMELTLQLEETPDLIGGICLRMGDNQFDASIRGRLEHLSRSVD